MGPDTPMLRQYRKIKQQHPDKLLFFRMGEFFELFYADAQKVAALLGITLTARVTADDKIPMAGVPVKSHEQYLSRLVRLGESVAVCDQIGTANKTGLIERKVTQIVTPGTLTDTALLPERSSSLALALAPGSSTIGYAWLDLARGELRASECTNKEVIDHLARLRPAEVILPEGHALPGGITTTLQHLQDWEFDPASAIPRLLKHFGINDLDGLGLADKPQAGAAMMALINYAEKTQCRPLDNLWLVGAENESQHLTLDEPARHSLEITTSSSRDGPSLLSSLDHCHTLMGSRLLARRLDNPLRSRERITARLDAIDAVSGETVTLANWLSRCCDLERIVSRVRLGTARPRELAGLREVLTQMPQLKKTLAAIECEMPSRFIPLIENYTEQSELLGTALADNPQAQLKQGGVIAQGYSAELDKLRNFQETIVAELESLVTDAGTTIGSPVNSGHHRTYGYYLELPRSQSGKAPPHWRRIQSTKHAERYKLDKLVEMDRQAETTDAHALELEFQLYTELITKLASTGRKLAELAEGIAQLDVAITLASLAAKHGWTRPQISDKPGITIEEGRHPVVETTVEHFVANGIKLEKSQRLHVLTGPNMGGKSTYMRQVALIALLAHTGAPVPAKSATIGLLDAIMTRIGAGDQLARGRSTFMVEMVEIAAILNSATPATLVILDEIGRGTSTYDGLSLAWATAQTLLERNRALVLLSTHYLELATLADEKDGAVNMHLAVDDAGDKVVMLHRVEPGALDRSFGLHVAAMAGVPRHCTELARHIFDQLGERISTNGDGARAVNGGAKLHVPPKPASNPALDLLAATDLDSITPREAQDLLYKLHQLSLLDRN